MTKINFGEVCAAVLDEIDLGISSMVRAELHDPALAREYYKRAVAP